MTVVHKDTRQVRMRKENCKGKSEREERTHHLSLNGPHDVSCDVAFEKITLKNVPSAHWRVLQ